MRAKWVHCWTQGCGQYFDQSLDRVVCLSKVFDFPDSVENGRMVATVESANPGRAPASNVFPQVHGNLPTETRAGPVPFHAPVAEMIRHRCFDLFQRQPPDSCSLIFNLHDSFLSEERHSHGQQTVRCRHDRLTRDTAATLSEPNRASFPAFRETFEDAHSLRSPAG